jgi:putative ABC transport system permease protein
MAALRIAIRSLLRRKLRMSLIGLLVVVGTVLLVFGGTFTLAAKAGSKRAIIDHFTGDLVIYSARSKDLPSPFSFQTALPVIEHADDIQAWLAADPRVAAVAGIAQNYGLINVERAGTKADIPFTFYAVDPASYQSTFDNLEITRGGWFGAAGPASENGLLISEQQAAQFREKYGVDLQAGEPVTLLSLTGGGSVNALPSRFLGTFKPRHYANVFNYVSFIDISSYSRLYNFTGVAAGSLPKGVEDAFAASSDADILGLGGNGLGGDSAGAGTGTALDLASLKQAPLSGYTMISVRLKDSDQAPALLKDLAERGFAVKTASWSQASSFFASVADILQGIILGITALIFLVVVLILMNTLIINILERTNEIGTYRALGADKSFVSAIFLWESLVLNLAAAGVGIVVSLVLILALGGPGLQLPELVSQYLVGGGRLYLRPEILPILGGLALVLVVAFAATLYPTRVAVSVSPLKAMTDK